MSLSRPEPRVLIVDDEPAIRQTLEILLKRNGYHCTTCSGAIEAIQTLRDAPQAFPVVLTDLSMPDGSGLDVISAATRRCEYSQTILLTAHTTVENAVGAMKLGAYDFIGKPYVRDELLVLVERALEKFFLLTENNSLKTRMSKEHSPRVVGKSASMQQVLALIDNMAPTRSSVLLTGESGTGKELAAQVIHEKSGRDKGPFLVVNCGALPENLMESELFGHEKGAFTGANQRTLGVFREAKGGTVFLDEIGELPLPLQVKLLRVLQERKVRPVGATREEEIDVRVIAATNRNMEEEVKQGRFRQDLYYRINVLRIELPPLRERKDDIPALAQSFIKRISSEVGRDVSGFTPDALRALSNHDFEGNVRELENIIERAVALSSVSKIGLGDLPPQISGIVGESGPVLYDLPPEGCELDEVVMEVERRLINSALERTEGVRTKAAKLLGISFRSLRYRLEKHGFEEDSPRSSQSNVTSTKDV